MMSQKTLSVKDVSVLHVLWVLSQKQNKTKTRTNKNKQANKQTSNNNNNNNHIFLLKKLVYCMCCDCCREKRTIKTNPMFILLPREMQT